MPPERSSKYEESPHSSTLAQSLFPDFFLPRLPNSYAGKPRRDWSVNPFPPGWKPAIDWSKRDPVPGFNPNAPKPPSDEPRDEDVPF